MPNKTIVAMACITAIVLTCLFRGIDGWVAIAGASIVSGLGGFAIRFAKKP